MARSAVAKAEAAAEALEAFLRGRPRADVHAAAGASPRTTVAQDANQDTAAMDPPLAGGVDLDLGQAARPVPARGAAPLRLPHTDWLHHVVTVVGPAEAVARFRAAACGAGTIPWELDLASLEEDWFHRLVDPAHRSLSLSGARVLAAQLRTAVERRHILAVARVDHSRACPFDLNALVPVAPDILALGPDHPEALAWLWQHWGTTEPLRHVTVVAADESRNRLVPPVPGWRLEFWSADWTPWRAIARIRADWPALQFDVQPAYN